MSLGKVLNGILKDQSFSPLSKKELKELLSLRYPSGQKVISETNPSSIVEVLGVLMAFNTYGEALNYFSEAETSTSMILRSPANRDAIQSVKLKREILSRDAPTAKTGYGKCPKCKNADLIGISIQLRSGDEGMNLLLSCPVQGCNYRSTR